VHFVLEEQIFGVRNFWMAYDIYLKRYNVAPPYGHISNSWVGVV
jgi:hypothetical protein